MATLTCLGYYKILNIGVSLSLCVCVCVCAMLMFCSRSTHGYLLHNTFCINGVF